MNRLEWVRSLSSFRRRAAAMVLAAAAAAVPLGADVASADQDNRHPHHLQPYSLDSGLVANPGGELVKVFEGLVHAPPGTPWMRVHFDDYRLGPGSFLTLTAKADGAVQRLDTRSLGQWRNKSAYFNGDTVRLELHAAPGESAAFVRVGGITVGEWVGVTRALQGLLHPGDDESQCGASDNRVPSADPRVGRTMPNGCSGWLVSNRANLTAGHCVSGALDSLHFNVPQSQADGTMVASHPDDQYPIEPVAAIDWFNDGPGAIGDDWAVFETFVNSNTGRHAVHVQDDFFRMTRDLTTVQVSNVTVTGHGIDFVPAGPTANNCAGGTQACNSSSSIQQTHSGSYLGETVQAASDVFIEYTVDTEGGNSGSPVIVPTPSGGFPALTLGIHTNAGCNPPSSGNTGTGFEHDGLEVALRNFPGSSNIVYVDENHFDIVAEDGTVFRPFDTFAEGVAAAAAAGGTPILSVVQAVYNEVAGAALLIDDPMLIEAPVGTVRIE